VKNEATMRRVGMVTEPLGWLGLTAPRAVYEALAPLACAACGRTIAVGDRFTRRRQATGGVSPACRACAPFAEP
jgi:hypothetical protein